MIVAIAGAQGCGKSTFSKIQMRKHKGTNRVLTFKPEDFDGTKFDIVEPCEIYGSLTEFIADSIVGSNELLIMDEAEIFIPKAEPNPKLRKGEYIKDPLKELFAGSRAYNRLIYCIFHSIKDFRERMWIMQYCSAFIRFNTQDKLNVEAQCFSSFPQIADNLKKVTNIPNFKYYFIPLR